MNIELRDYFAAKAMPAVYSEYCSSAEKVGFDEGWIEWNGGAYPVAHGTVVGVRPRAGGYEEAAARRFRWDHLGGGSDIIAYRGVQP